MKKFKLPKIAWLKQYFQDNKLEVLLLASIVLLATVLRFYNLRDGIVFLGDEGRDALAVKRIVLDLNPTLLGPTASVGGFYLGPVYYYMIAPFFLLFGMDPVGGAVFVALTGVATLVLLYWFVRHLFGTQAAMVSSLFYAVSPGILRFSRSSWNPNPIPFFILLSIISLYWGIKTSTKKLIFISGMFLGIVIQLHYLGLISTGAIGLTLLLLTNKSIWIKNVLSMVAGFLLGASMYLAFELRHGFPNVRAVIEFVTREGGATGVRDWNLVNLFIETNRFNLEAVLGQWSLEYTYTATLIFLGLILVAFVRRVRSKLEIELGEKVIFAYWLIGTLGMMMYRGQWHYHYFSILFIVPFLLLGWLIGQINRKAKIELFLISVPLALLLAVEAPTWSSGSKLIDQTERVSQAVIDLSEGEPFNFALITDGNSDHAYRFFLEINDAEPTPLEEGVETQLIAVCEKYPEPTCAPLGNPLWEIAGFGRAEIDEQIEVYPQITIYRLTHHEDSLDQIGEPARQGQ